MASAKKKTKTIKESNSDKLHRIIVEEPETRKKLYEAFGRVRCYMYKTGRTKPLDKTAKRIEKLTRGRVAAPNW